ncbi:MAG TPA: transposase [Longimicrobiales bacterium]|nr:transposase [Longimicrobiales bacterium]
MSNESAAQAQFTREFKVAALRLFEESGKPLSQVARELGIRPDLLYSWKRGVRKSRPLF